MKNRLFRYLSICCAVLLLTGAVSAWAEEPATPTDLVPAAAGEPVPAGKQPEPEKNPEITEDGRDSVEIVITKSVRVGSTWSGQARQDKPVILKLDVAKARTIHLLAEGKNLWVTVEKADRQTENPARTETDPETEHALLTWNAEAGSYLVTLGPVEPVTAANAVVTFMDDEAFAAWEEAMEAEQTAEPETEETEAEATEAEETEAEEPEAEEPEATEPETDEPETAEEAETVEEEPETAEEATEPEIIGLETATTGETTEEPGQDAEPEVERDVTITMTWDTEMPDYGDTAHFRSVLTGYDDLVYTLQWQTSPDRINWTDFTGAVEPELDVTLTEELDGHYFRLVVYLEEETAE